MTIDSYLLFLSLFLSLILLRIILTHYSYTILYFLNFSFSFSIFHMEYSFSISLPDSFSRSSISYTQIKEYIQIASLISLCVMMLL